MDWNTGGLGFSAMCHASFVILSKSLSCSEPGFSAINKGELEGRFKGFWCFNAVSHDWSLNPDKLRAEAWGHM